MPLKPLNQTYTSGFRAPTPYVKRKTKFHCIQGNFSHQRIRLQGNKLIKHDNRLITIKEMQAYNKSFLESQASLPNMEKQRLKKRNI